MPLDASPPGTAASVTIDPGNSNASQSSIIVVCHGFYVTPRTAPDGSLYSEIDVPGLQKLSIIGAPDLPIVRQSLAIVTNAPQATLTSMTPLAPRVGFSYHVWPLGGPAMQDSIHPTIYSSSAPYPASPGMARPIHLTLGSIPAASIECYPFLWTPSRNDLEVYPMTRWTFTHDGPLMAFDTITQDRNRLAVNTYLNWQEVNSVIPPSFLHYQGEYLFIYPMAYAGAIKPLVTQKYMRGWNVTTLTTESIGTITCDNVRTAIKNWYSTTPSSHDHDCLLVGDINVIPYCGSTESSDPRSDDPYGSVQPFGTEDVLMARDIFVGRLPGFSAADISNQVTKIINYEDHPPGQLYYGNVLLMAHTDDPTMFGQGNFVEQQQVIQGTSYKVSPLFAPFYGNDPGKTNAGVNAEINTGEGIVCYNGHGWTFTWPQWNSTGSCPSYGTSGAECYTYSDVTALHNGPLYPIVWSLACQTSNLQEGNCCGRAWMAKGLGGAAAFYGATRDAGALDIDTEEDSLFTAVWTYGITNIAHATTFAEDEGLKWNNGAAYENAFIFTLFGDPDMTIRRDRPPIWQTVVPSQIVLTVSGQQSLDIQVTDAAGAPVQDVLIGIFKPASAPSGAAQPAGPTAPQRARPATVQTAAEVADNTYTGADGHAHFLIAAQTPGFLYYTVRDSAGGSVVDSIPVVGAAAVGGGPLATAGLWAAPSVTRSATALHFGRPLEHPGTLTIFDAMGRAVATLTAPAGTERLEWSGRDASGVLVRSGLYFARLEEADTRRLARIVIRR